MSRNRCRPLGGFTLIELLLTLTVLGVLGGWLGWKRYQQYVEDRMWTNMHYAKDALRVLAKAQQTWRRADPDGNGRGDYWTVDVYGLHQLKDQSGRPVNAIPEEVALADRFPRRGETRYAAQPPAEPVPYHGYYFEALVLDQDGKPYGGEGETRFGYRIIPARHGNTGVITVQINEEGVTYACHLGFGAEANPAQGNWEGGKDPTTSTRPWPVIN